MVRKVQRRTPRKKTQPPKIDKPAVGLCGWCITRTHEQCLGMRSDIFVCTCRACYGPATTTEEA